MPIVCFNADVDDYLSVLSVTDDNKTNKLQVGGYGPFSGFAGACVGSCCDTVHVAPGFFVSSLIITMYTLRQVTVISSDLRASENSGQ